VKRICLALATLLILGCQGQPGFQPAPAASRSGSLQLEGDRLYQQRKFVEAGEKYRQSLAAASSPREKAMACTAIASCLDELDELDEAKQMVEEGIAQDATYGQAWVTKGVIHRHAGDLDKAERCYREAEKLDPESPFLHASLGALYLMRDKPEEALQSLDRAVALNPSVAVSHANRSLALATLGRHDEADAALRKAVALGYANGDVLQPRLKALRELDAKK
jgi:tetratricopeptide (TPR) repeat protein